MLPKRKATRIPEFNYAGRHYYFVTICVHHFQRWFGEVVGEKMVLNEYGEIVKDQWHWLEEQYPYVELASFVAMPNHVHGIIGIVGTARPPFNFVWRGLAFIFSKRRMSCPCGLVTTGPYDKKSNRFLS